MAVANTTLNLDIEDGHVPLRITATLRTGIGFDPPYGLDLAGMLAARLRAVAQADLEHRGTLTTTPLPDTTEEDPGDLSLPLSRCLTGPDWHWLASCAIPLDPDPDPEPRTFYRTVDSAWAERSARRPLPYFHPSKGPHRDIMMPAPVILCREVEWHAVGSKERVSSLLSTLRFIGRRRAVGEGGVLDWTVTEVDEQPGDWAHLADDMIVRPCPQECAESLGAVYDLGWYAIRPPSWHPDRLRQLAMSAATEDEW